MPLCECAGMNCSASEARSLTIWWHDQWVTGIDQQCVYIRSVWGVKEWKRFCFAASTVPESDILVSGEQWPPSPRHTPLFLTVRLPVSHQCSPFFSAALTESPALFPVVQARRLVTAEGGRQSSFSLPNGLGAGVKARAQHRAAAPRSTLRFTISRLSVTAAQCSMCPRSFP